MSFDAIRLRRPDGAKPGDTKAAVAELETTERMAAALVAQLPNAARAALVLAYDDPDRWSSVANLLGTTGSGDISLSQPIHVQASLRAVEHLIHSAVSQD